MLTICLTNHVSEIVMALNIDENSFKPKYIRENIVNFVNLQ